MNKHYYEILGVSESATDEEIRARYEELKKKYSEERFLEGEAGNEAARMLNRIDVAYNEETDVLSFSPNGDYIRVDTDETAKSGKKEEQ